MNTQRRNIHFKLTGNSYVKDDQGRPIPHVLVVEDPVYFISTVFHCQFRIFYLFEYLFKRKSAEAARVYNEAKKSVHIPTLFKVIFVYIAIFFV